jgi:2-haloacid dehalogenase
MPKDLIGSVLAFDVYGTLIDPFQVEDHVRAAFGEHAKEATEVWRSKQLEYSFRRAAMKKYENFDVCTAQALRFVCRHFGVSVTEETVQRLLEKYLQLPAYSDVTGALAKLKSCGFKIVACSNGTHSAVHTLLDRAGVFSYFSAIVSVDPLRTFKPDPAVYEFLAEQVHTGKEKLWMISSNPFDVIGAKACGLRTSWVQRDPQKVFDPWGFEPDLVVHGLEELAEHLVAQ